MVVSSGETHNLRKPQQPAVYRSPRPHRRFRLSLSVLVMPMLSSRATSMSSSIHARVSSLLMNATNSSWTSVRKFSALRSYTNCSRGKMCSAATMDSNLVVACISPKAS